MSTTMVGRGLLVTGGADAARRAIAGPVVPLLGAALGALVVGWTVAHGSTDVARLLIAAAAVGCFIVVALRSPALALDMVVVWLLFVGIVRRLFIPFAGWSESDPLLLIAPGCAVVLLVAARGRDLRPPRSALAGLVAVMALLTLAHVFNPHEESLAVATRALLFWAGPLLWFFVGRILDREGERRLRRVLLAGGAVVVAHGLYQSWFGPLGFELTWVGVSQFGPAIFFEDFKIRPFSTLVSPQEYGMVLALILSVLWARLWSRPPRMAAWVLGFLLTFVALVLQGTRTILLLTMVMLVVTSVIRSRSFPVRLAIVSTVVGLIVFLSGVEGKVELGEGQPWVFAEHQINGLLHPSDSTGPLHVAIIQQSVDVGLREPFGVGMGTNSLAGRKDGDLNFYTAENDLAQSFAAFGVVGAAIFFCLFLASHITVARRYLRTRRLEHLAAIGMLIVFTGQWLGNGMYSATALLWLTIGAASVETARGD